LPDRALRSQFLKRSFHDLLPITSFPGKYKIASVMAWTAAARPPTDLQPVEKPPKRLGEQRSLAILGDRASAMPAIHPQSGTLPKWCGVSRR
jgi:hypothetical protein